MLRFFARRPALGLILSFLFLIILGSILLKIPYFHIGRLSWVDSVFTATSATCVTGLIVKDTPNDFTRAGQIVILILIQLGGMGIMTFSMSIAVLLGKKLGFASKTIINKMIDYDRPGYTVFILKKVISLMIIVEFIGTIFLIVAFSKNGIHENLIFHSVFHCISAFCNAGFSTFSNSLMNFSTSFSINIIVMSLIILGGLGFFVIIEAYSFLVKKIRNDAIIKKPSIQLKMVLYSSIFLILAVTIMFFAIESTNILKGMPFGEKVLISSFQSVTTRTAGFNTINIGMLNRVTLLIFIMLMFVGAGPGGTAGGIKITTVFVFLKSVFAMATNSKEVYAFGRKVPEEIVNKASAVFFISILINFVAICILSFTESAFSLKEIMFEVVSAFGTVGLSTGLTGDLSQIGRVVIIVLMFIGRLGPVTLAVAISKQNPKVNYSLPEEKVMIG
ncbi:MAG: hypothetical protein C0601_03180 [Candidatus Muiribacterium halophilum]|uniref:Trk family potassium uptake protein n=1 Tax=Muiribacterium halophilum TaxID=2053465 RepID=A0A2N5ZK22_MUIH1|nr:MAG: hypothetical protein C0601_03180 [Candidatus Muirbacterium halophilum]